MTRRKSLTALLCLVFAAALLFAATGLNTAKAEETDIAPGYYYDQLYSQESKDIYDILAGMEKSGDLLTGTATVDLVEKGVLENRPYTSGTISSYFSAARDAFFLDRPDVFYVDGDLLTVRQLTDADGNYSITFGIGREDTYLKDGFTSSDVSSKVSSFNFAVEDIVSKAGQFAGYLEQVEYVFDYLSKNTTYALEDSAKAENIPYVRTPYGAMVCKEACCQGFAEAFKIILDKLDIPCVLVQGVYSDENEGDVAHMWTFVKMDDGRWYMCDPTMQSLSTVEGKYFLVNGTEEIMQCYCLDGTISLSEYAYTFNYPHLSGVEYAPSDLFSVTKNETGDYIYVSYNKMGITAAEEEGIYILVSYDYGTSWSYLDRSFEMGGFTRDKYDRDTYFMVFLNSRISYTFAATKITPPADKTIQDFAEYYEYSGSLTDIFDISYTTGDGKISTVAPYVVKTTVLQNGTEIPARLSPNSTYTVTVTYSETLACEADADLDVVFVENINNVSASDVNVKNVSWDGDKTVTFTFSTKQTYHSSIYYYFEVNNVYGTESRLHPIEIGFNVVNTIVFNCPIIGKDYTTVYASTPALIATEDLSTEGWTYADGEAVSSSLPYKLSLVVSYPSEEDSEGMISDIEDLGVNVLGSSTYSLSLGLCDKQVEYVTGGKILVMIPFPDGYNYDSTQEGISFKAYHFTDEGEAEEIDVVVTESGLIIYCESFSPYAIVATDDVQTTKNIAVLASKGGSAGENLVKVTKGENAQIVILADDGKVIDGICLNGTYLDFEGDSNYTLTLSYDELIAAGNMLEISFASESVVKSEQAAGYTAVHISNSDTKSSLGLAGWEKGIISLAVILVFIALIIIALLIIREEKKKKTQDGQKKSSKGKK